MSIIEEIAKCQDDEIILEGTKLKAFREALLEAPWLPGPNGQLAKKQLKAARRIIGRKTRSDQPLPGEGMRCGFQVRCLGRDWSVE